MVISHGDTGVGSLCPHLTDAIVNKTITYEYNYVGNITSVKTYIYTTGTLGTPLTTQNYTYNSQNQRTDLSYDANGNMTSLNGYTFGWTNRRLTSATSTDTNIAYTYNHNGIRTSKTINGSTTYYKVDENNNVVKQYELVNAEETNVIQFVYDSNNSPIYFTYNTQHIIMRKICRVILLPYLTQTAIR